MCRPIFVEFNTEIVNFGKEDEIAKKIEDLHERYSSLPYDPPKDEIDEILDTRDVRSSKMVLDITRIDYCNPTDSRGNGVFENTNVVFKDGTAIIITDDYETVKEMIYGAMGYEIEYEEDDTEA